MTAHKLQFMSDGPFTKKVILEGQDISHMVRVLSFEAEPGGLPVVQLELLVEDIDVPETLADIELLDGTETINLRQNLLEALDLIDILGAGWSDAAQQELKQQRPVENQRIRWRMQGEGPRAHETLGQYRLRIREELNRAPHA